MDQKADPKRVFFFCHGTTSPNFRNYENHIKPYYTKSSILCGASPKLDPRQQAPCVIGVFGAAFDAAARFMQPKRQL
jgi:hypothetical protein